MDRREDGRLVERAAVMRVITSAVFQRMNREVYNKVYRFFVRVIPCDSNRDNVCLSLESLKLVIRKKTLLEKKKKFKIQYS